MIGPRLQDAILGPAASLPRDGPVVIGPPGRLHAVPWALLPALYGRAFSVAPSAGAWMRARAMPPPSRHDVTLVRGPGLGSEGAEVPSIAHLHDNVTVLAGAEATATRVLSELDGAWLAHIAAHGTFRADNPMFSSLRLEDGPVTVYEVEQLRRAPHRLVLSSCDCGVMAPTGADELLGLADSLLPLGTAGIIAGIIPLDDLASRRAGHGQPAPVPATGPGPSRVECSVRREVADEPDRRAAALSLLALGAP